jgi:hypothetical protein
MSMKCRTLASTFIDIRRVPVRRIRAATTRLGW